MSILRTRQHYKRMSFVKNIAAIFMAMLLASVLSLLAFSKSEADSPRVIPIRVGVLVDESYRATGTDSELYQNVKRLLDVNKIPFDTLDVSDVNSDIFIDQSSRNINYAVLLIMSPGWRITHRVSRGILAAAERGMGLVALLPDAVNKQFKLMFGIAQMGQEWQIAERLSFEKDSFTFSYEGQSIEEGEFLHLDYSLLPDTDVVARLDSGSPGVWTYQHGSGKSVVHNHANTSIFTYSGILFQSILYAMPIGVASPINAGVIEVDDFPRAFTSPEEVQEYYYDFYTNLDRWLRSYKFKASYFIAFSYSGNTSDFWKYPESLEATYQILASENELGLHCGSKHIPLELEYWDGESAIDAEVNVILDEIERLKLELKDKYGAELGEIVTYVAPANRIGDYGYSVLAQKTDIRYVGTGYISSAFTYEGNSSEQRRFILPTLRDFGREGNNNIYNLPRIQAGFYYFDSKNKDADKYENAYSWNLMRSSMESGDAYVVFTHPDAGELIRETNGTNTTLENIFQAYTVWADYVSQTYPYYRWWTAGRLGDYLSGRQGVTEAEWLPDENTLRVRLSQPDDAIHIKTEKYLSAISREDETLILKFQDAVTGYDPEEYHIFRTHMDYFIYPEEGEYYRPDVSEPGFAFVRVTPPEPIRLLIEDPAQDQQVESTTEGVGLEDMPENLGEDTEQTNVNETEHSQVKRIAGLPMETITSFAFAAFVFILGIILVFVKRFDR